MHNQKKILILVGIASLALMAWRVSLIINVPNLLRNPGFEADGLSDWQIVEQAGARAALGTSGHDPTRDILELVIPDTREGSWTGAGQRATIEPNQRYAVAIDYHLADEAQSSSKIILRLAQFGQTGELISSVEISPPEPLVAGATGERVTQSWRVLRHNFVTDNEAAAVEIGIGLFGYQATTVEIDNIILALSPTWPEAVRQDPVLLLLLLLGVGWLSYGSYRGFAGLLATVTRGIWSKRRLIAIGVVNILLLFIFAELLALGLYFIRDGKLFYVNRTRYRLIEVEDGEKELTPKRIHPYFGYVDRPGWQRGDDSFWRDLDLELRTINNHGLGSPYDYPYVKTNQDQYFIGVFGGSVAERFALSAGQELIKNLQEDGYFAQKDIVVLNFAKGGYKQPQQLLILSYFLAIGQEFDMIINIDGFNEVAFGHRNYQRHVDVSMPHINILEGLINLSDQVTLAPEKLGSLAKINQYKTKLNELADAMNSTEVASLNFILEQYYAIILNDYEKELNRFNEFDSNLLDASLHFVKPYEAPLEDSLLFGNIAETWASASVMMHHILEGREIAYFHFLQPNQHYSNKIFSEAEAERALEREAPYYSTLVGIGYPILTEKFDVLSKSGVNFYNGIPIFDDETEMVYVDNCCHYNQLGNEILAEFIAAAILGSEDIKEKVASNQNRN